MRSALGASRRRVVTWLFMEALVLSVAAAAVVAGVALGMVNDYWKLAAMPFWIVLGLSPGMIVYVAGLAIVAAAIVGVVPALKATGRRVQPGLQQLSSRGSAMQLGRTWTALIVVQVGIAVAALPAAINFAEQSGRPGTRDPAIMANDLLRTSLVMAGEESPTAVDSAAYERVLEARFADRTAELIRRLEAEPEISGVTFARHFPGTEAGARLEVESTATLAEDTSGGAGRQGPMRSGVRTNQVDIDLFRVFDIPILAVGIVALMLSVLLLSAAGIYAMMSFTVARRRREIGIRVALGADPRRVLSAIFTRDIAQLGTGVLAGVVVNVAFEWLVAGPGSGIMGDEPATLLPAVAALMVGVGLLAALGPARRGLAVQPAEVLREE